MSGNYYISKQRDTGNYYEQYERNQLKKANDMNKFISFTEDAKVYFLSEALNYILSKCMGSTYECCDYGREVCRTFVREEGCNNLMRRFAQTTHTLALVEQCVREACDTVESKSDKDNCLTWTIKDTEQQKFFDSLKDLPVSKLTKVINQRVCDAAEDFVQHNINMKLDIEEIATKTKERIDAAKAKYDEKKAAQIQKEQMIEYRRAADAIKSAPVKNIYEHMMNIASKAILENDELRDSFINESGQFDMSKVESRVKTMYTFLEMVNSLKIKKVNNKYIEECLASIK